MTRRGFSLAELMVALVIAGIIGAALTRLVVSQARFVARQDGYMKARAVARAGLNVLADEMRQVSDFGVTQAAPESVTLRVPFAYGIACGQTGGTTIAALLPPDSARLASAVTSGYAWRDTTFVWNFVEPATSAAYSTATCSSAIPSVAVLPSPGAATYAVALTPNVVTTPVGSPVYLYQRIRYSIANSGEIAGHKALWREVIGAGFREELVAPLDTTTRFAFLVGSLRRVQLTVPTTLDSVVGLRVVLGGTAETTPQGMAAPPKFTISTDVVFRNHGP